MRIAVVASGNKKTACLLHHHKLFDLNTLAALYQKGNPKNYPKSAVSFHADNIFNVPNSVTWLHRIYDFLIERIERNDENISAAHIPDHNIRYYPPVPQCPCMFGVVQNSPQFWRKKNQDIKNFVAGYIRAPGSLIGHRERIEIPDYSGSFRCAAELGVVISREARNVDVQNAMEYVFGYTCVNDMISNCWKEFARERNPDRTPEFYEYLINSYYGRGTKDFGPVGPCIVSKDEVNDPYNILLYTKFNGKIMDRSYNNAMIFDIETVISRLSSFMTLRPGTVIHMGTMGIDGITIEETPNLNKNDYVEIEIENVGSLTNFFDDRRDRQG
jgi:2-keto-4-pentenoate hydratase/2-oxohepta-3-ene-1,7-dioic acid hydratase in catechol pathway